MGTILEKYEIKYIYKNKINVISVKHFLNLTKHFLVFIKSYYIL